MTLDFHTILLLSCVCMCYGIDVRLVDATGALSNVGLLQVKTDGGFGSVCGANLATADVVCRALGYAGGSVSSSACSSYGGGNLCGASGTPVVKFSRASVCSAYCFAAPGHGQSDMQRLGVVTRRMLLDGARRGLPQPRWRRNRLLLQCRSVNAAGGHATHLRRWGPLH